MIYLLFAITQWLSSYNYVDALEEGMEGERINYYSLQKINYIGSGEDKYSYEINFKIEDINFFKEKFKEHKFYYVFNELEGSLEKNIYSMIPDKDEYYISNIYGGMELNEGLVDELGFKFIYGDYPKEDNEIVITKYTYEIFKEYGYRDFEGNLIEIKEPKDMEDKEIEIGGKKYKVRGVIDTQYDERRYEVLKDIEKNKVTYTLRSKH